MIEPEPTPRQRRWARRVRMGLAAIWLAPIGIGLRLLFSGRPSIGIIVTAVGAIMFVMSLRAARYGSDFVVGGPHDGDVAPPVLDHLIVATIGLPLLLVVFLIVALVTGD